MTVLIPLTRIKARGKWLPIGVPFDFNEEEIEQLRGQTPPALRVPINEVIARHVELVEEVKPAPAPKRGGKKDPTEGL